MRLDHESSRKSFKNKFQNKQIEKAFGINGFLSSQFKCAQARVIVKL